jgi:hypothetical protein
MQHEQDLLEEVIPGNCCVNNAAKMIANFQMDCTDE